MTETTTDIKEAARAALSAALRDPRVGFAIKAGMMGGAYEAFMGAVEAAIAAERERCAKVAHCGCMDHMCNRCGVDDAIRAGK